MKTRKAMIEDSYENETLIWVDACGLCYHGVVVDINQDNSFVLMSMLPGVGREEFNTFYPDEVVRDIESYFV